MYIILSQRKLRWLDHVLRMSDERIPKDPLYIELVVGKCNVGLRYNDVCKRDLNLDIDKWEKIINDPKNGDLLSAADFVKGKIDFRRPKKRTKELESE